MPAFHTYGIGLLIVLFSLPTDALAQAPVPADSADVETVDAIIDALYDVLSSPAGSRNWERMRALHHPSAHLAPLQPQSDGTYRAAPMTIEAFIQYAAPYLEQNAFYEREIARTTEHYGHLTHVFSTYELLSHPDDPAPFARGINSIQLVFEHDRWWILHAAWQPESPDLLIPSQYLPAADTDQ